MRPIIWTLAGLALGWLMAGDAYPRLLRRIDRRRRRRQWKRDHPNEVMVYGDVTEIRVFPPEVEWCDVCGARLDPSRDEDFYDETRGRVTCAEHQEED